MKPIHLAQVFLDRPKKMGGRRYLIAMERLEFFPAHKMTKEEIDKYPFTEKPNMIS